MDDLIGQQFGNYRLIRLLGRGGFAHVYLGEHIHLQTQVAIKILSTQLVPKDLERFQREARTVASLNHPHIVHVFDFGIENNLPFLVMNYASQGTLQQRYAQESQLPLATVLDYVSQVASALHYAHERKIIHRDVKPENMLIGNEGEILLSDFGIAATSATSTSQQTKTTAGTAVYMAPEQIMGKPGVASDQYALGILVYSWLCGEHPFQGSFFEICAQHMHAPVPSLRAKNPRIPLEVEQCVLKSLAKDPTQRFASVQDFAAALLNGSAETLPAATLQSLQRTVTYPNATSIRNQPGAFPPAGSDDPTYVKTPFVAGSDDLTSIKTEQSTPPITAGNTPLPIATIPTTPSNAGPTDVTARDTGPRQGESTDPIVSPPFPPTVPAAQKRKARRVALVALLGTLILALVGSGLGYAVIHGSGGANNPSGATVTITPAGATVTITPASTDLKNAYTITAVMGTPDVAQHQVAARQVSATTPAHTQTVSATGTKITPGTHATGQVTVQSYDDANPLTLAAGTTVPNNSGTGSSSLLLVLDAPVSLPVYTPGVGDYVNVPAHISQIGAIGNFPGLTAGQVSFEYKSPNNHPSCAAWCWWIYDANAFTGGTDPQTHSVVAQSDIDNTANSLERANQPDTTQTVQGQIHANERLVGTPSCVPNVQANHQAGDQTTSVTITVSYTCTGEAYDQDGTLVVVTQWLKDDATRSPGAGYALVGQVKTSQIQASIADANQGTVSIAVTAEGIWVYQFSDAQKTQLAQLLVGKSKSDAQAILQNQQGVKQANIQFSGNTTILPTDPGHITITIQSVSGL